MNFITKKSIMVLIDKYIYDAEIVPKISPPKVKLLQEVTRETRIE